MRRSRSWDSSSRRLVALLALAAGFATVAVAATSRPGGGVPSPMPGAGIKRPAATSAPPRSTPKKAAGPTRSINELAFEARQLEDDGAYAKAADVLKQLRKRTKLDGDLEIALAMDEARSGQPDSALARISTPMMLAAANDSMPTRRRAEYPFQRETYWLQGKFDGWNWYILRTRAELEARRGHWKEAAAWAKRATDAWTLNGKDWHILAVCAAQAGDEALARQATAQAVLLDPMLSEARYLAGLWAWRDGKRAEAAEDFRRAVYLDSTAQAPALALIRVRLPGTQPDPLPTELLSGIHQVALLTSPLGPKPEEFVQMDTPAALESSPDTAVVDSVPPGVRPYRLIISVLVDEHGLPVLDHLPWFAPSSIDFRKIIRILASIPGMRFSPATRRSQPYRVWVSLDYDLLP